MLNKGLFIFIFFSLTLFGCHGVDDNKPSKTNNSEQEETSELELPKKHLKKFDTHDSVQVLNDHLLSLGYEVNNTKHFDSLTTWALTDIQLQFLPEHVSGMYDEQTRDILNQLKDNQEKIVSEKKLKKTQYPDRLPEVTDNPFDVLALVNKEHALPSDYIPHDLVVPNVRFPFTEDVPKKQLRKMAADALENLFKASDEAGLELYAQSGYRSYDRQKTIFDNNVARHGEDHANTYSARPGESEHQTGLVMDVTNRTVNFELTTDFGETKEGQWLKDNAHLYGFIIRYPEDKVEITKYQYEPWHIRYVGEALASELYENNLSLEEHYQKNLEEN